MDPTITAAIIGSITTVVCLLLSHHFHKQNVKIADSHSIKVPRKEPLFVENKITLNSSPLNDVPSNTHKEKKTEALIDSVSFQAEIFSNNDQLYFAWLKNNPQGFVLNSYRQISSDYMVLHSSSCSSISKYAENARPGGFTERDFIKICSTSLEKLKEWAKKNGRGDSSFSKICNYCKPLQLENIQDKPIVEIFSNNDNAYLQWLSKNQNGFIVNSERNLSPNYMVLHKSNCSTISQVKPTDKPGGFTERNYVKVCSNDLSSLKVWAKQHGRMDSSFSKECGYCKPNT